MHNGFRTCVIVRINDLTTESYHGYCVSCRLSCQVSSICPDISRAFNVMRGLKAKSTPFLHKIEVWLFHYLFQVCQGNHASRLFWSFIMKNPVKFRLFFFNHCTSQRITHGTRSDESNDFPSAQTPPPPVSRHLLRHLCWFSLHFNALSVCCKQVSGAENVKDE